MPAFYCSSCGRSISVPDTFTSAAVACPACDAIVAIPPSARGVVASPTQDPRLAPGRGTQPTPPPPPAMRSTQPSLPPQSAGAFRLRWLFIASGIAWLILFVEVGVNAHSLSHDRSVAARMGESLVYLLVAGVLALIIALILAAIMLIFEKRFLASVGRVFSIGIVTLASLMLLGAYAVSRLPTRGNGQRASAQDMKDADAAFAGMREDFNKLVSEHEASNRTRKPPTFRFPANKAASNDFDQLRSMLQGFFNDLLGLQGEYLVALHDAGLERLLDPVRMANESSPRESYEILDRVRQVAQQMAKRAEELGKAYPRRIDETRMDAETKKAALKIFQEMDQSMIAHMREAWDLELSCADVIQQLVDHLESTKQYWKPVDGKFSFQRQADRDRFRELMAAIRDKETEAKNKAAQNAQLPPPNAAGVEARRK